MLKNLFAALFRREKKTMPEPARTEQRLPDRPVSRPAPRTEQRLQTPRASTPTASRVVPSQPARHDDSLTNPAHPLSPLNPIHSTGHNHRAHDPVTTSCDDSPRSSWGSSSDYSSSCSSDSGSSCSSSCD